MSTSKRSDSYKKLLILAIILVMPGLLFYFLNKKAENRYLSLPVLGPKALSGTYHSVRGKKIPDTLFHQVERFAFYNQDSVLTKFPADSGGISIVGFFYADCERLCPEVTAGTARLAGLFWKNNFIQFYSISLDSLDTPARLKEYARDYPTDKVHWNFLSSPKQDEAIELARGSFLTDALPYENGFILSPNLILIDSKRRIRGYYDASRKDQIDLLIDEIKLLVTEEIREKKYF